MLIDSHCHLDEDKYKEDGLDVVIKRAEEKGVSYFLTVGTNLAEFPAVIEIAEKYPQIYASLGIHPHHAEEDGSQFEVEDYIKLAEHEKGVSIGKCGLDYFFGN